MLFTQSKYLLYLALFLLLSFCNSPGVDPITGKKILREPNIFKKVEDNAKEGRGIIKGGIGGGGSQTTYNFGTSNVLWRSTLKTLDFMPLQTVDYSGGVIITDWFGTGNDNKQINLQLIFFRTKLQLNQ